MPIDSSEMDVGTQADIVDLVPVELAVGRVAAEVLQEEPEVPRHQEAVELHAGAQREVEVSSPDAAPPRAGRAAAPTARTRTAMPIFPNVMSGFLSAWLLHPVQERLEQLAELVGALDDGAVGGVGQDGQLGIADALVEDAGHRRGRAGIALADDDERGARDGADPLAEIRPGDGPDGRGVAPGAGVQEHLAHAVDDRLLGLPDRRGGPDLHRAPD